VAWSAEEHVEVRHWRAAFWKFWLVQTHAKSVLQAMSKRTSRAKRARTSRCSRPGWPPG
jgi:DNA/RNA-binding domain of Phe-tRNA-synthetase-like protein